ncbi:MAG: alginate export family protein [Bryobacteraceae bacterium]
MLEQRLHRPVQARVSTLVRLSLVVACGPVFAQYDKVAALGSDSALTPIGGPATAPSISTGPYDLPDLRPTGMLNDQLPNWLQFGLDERVRWEGYSGGGFKPNNNASYFLNRFRFGMLVRPADWFKVVAQVQDARSFLQSPPLGPPNNVRWDLKLAYAQFGDEEKQPVAVSVGRQLIDYNNTIIANSEWRNQARSYDGVVTKIHVDRFRAAVFAASVVIPQLYGISHHQEGNNIYGAYGWITRVLPKSSIEPFTLWRVEPSVAVEASEAKTGHLNEMAYGFRVRGTGISNFDYRYELVREGGSAGTNNIDAWATTTGAGYTVAGLGWKPRFFTGYDYASGDSNPKDGIRGTFDSMYPTAHDRFGIIDQFGWQNIMAGRAGATVNPHRRWSVTAQYLDYWLASATDAAYNTSGGVILRDPTGKSGRHLGDEFDVYTWYEINREVHVGIGVGHLLPGEFIARAGKGAAYTYPYFAIEIFDGKRVH